MEKIIIALVFVWFVLIGMLIGKFTADDHSITDKTKYTKVRDNTFYCYSLVRKYEIK